LNPRPPEPHWPFGGRQSRQFDGFHRETEHRRRTSNDEIPKKVGANGSPNGYARAPEMPDSINGAFRCTHAYQTDNASHLNPVKSRITKTIRVVCPAGLGARPAGKRGESTSQSTPWVCGSHQRARNRETRAFSSGMPNPAILEQSRESYFDGRSENDMISSGKAAMSRSTVPTVCVPH